MSTASQLKEYAPKKSPVFAADIKPEWVAQVRETIVRDGHKIRRGPDSSIEVSGTGGGWYLLNLPGETSYFVNKSDRDEIFEKLKP